MGIKTFNPKKVTITLASALGSHIVKGFDNGEFVGFEFESEAYTHEAGADGEEARFKNNDRRATLRIILLQSSDSNKYLSDVENLDRISDGGVMGLYLKDATTGEFIASDACWVKKRAAWSRDVGKTSMTWELSVKSPDVNFEGASET